MKDYTLKDERQLPSEIFLTMEYSVIDPIFLICVKEIRQKEVFYYNLPTK